MKNRFCALLLAALILTALTGCVSGRAAGRTNIPKTPTENRPTVTEGTTAPAPMQTNAVHQQTTAPATTELTAAEAEAIALEHVGLTADQVTRLRTEYEIDDGVPQYDVQFYRDGMEYEFEIHAKTGAIISFDKDRD